MDIASGVIKKVCKVDGSTVRHAARKHLVPRATQESDFQALYLARLENTSSAVEDIAKDVRTVILKMANVGDEKGTLRFLLFLEKVWVRKDASWLTFLRELLRVLPESLECRREYGGHLLLEGLKLWIIAQLLSEWNAKSTPESMAAFESFVGYYEISKTLPSTDQSLWHDLLTEIARERLMSCHFSAEDLVYWVSSRPMPKRLKDLLENEWFSQQDPAFKEQVMKCNKSAFTW